jgi:hypothetical protein
VWTRFVSWVRNCVPRRRFDAASCRVVSELCHGAVTDRGEKPVTCENGLKQWWRWRESNPQTRSRVVAVQRAFDLVRVHFGVTASDRHCPRLTAMLCHRRVTRPARSSTRTGGGTASNTRRALPCSRQESVSTNRSTPTDSCDRTPALERLGAPFCVACRSFCAARVDRFYVSSALWRSTLRGRYPLADVGAVVTRPRPLWSR